MKLNFLKPGTTVEGTISSVEVVTRGAHSFLEITWLAEGNSVRESHFMTNYDEIVESLGKIGISVDTDTDTWIGQAAKLLIESENGYLNAKIVGPAETIVNTGAAINFDAQETPVQTAQQPVSAEDILNA